MKQTSNLTQSLSLAQELHARNRSITFRVYTESKPNLPSIVARYFSGATLIPAIGLWQGVEEASTIIEILGSGADVATVVHLAGDIGFINSQVSVLVAYDNVRIDVPGVVAGL